jgi:UDP-N-acetyl-D-glucosamine dehydrogenase
VTQQSRPRFIVDKVQAALNKVRKPVTGSKTHVLGVAYKRDISDVRESPALAIIGLLQRLGGEVTYSNLFVPKIELESGTLESSPVSPTVADADCVVALRAFSASLRLLSLS